MSLLKKQLSDDQKNNAAEIVFSKIERTRTFLSAKTILVYWSTTSELHTHEFIKKWSREKTILIPLVHGENMTVKKFIAFDEPAARDSEDSDEHLEPKTEPYKGKAELAIIPGIAFDLKKNRLGRGGGYYDSYLSAKNIHVFGVGFDFQLMDKIPVKWGSLKMNKIFSPNQVIE